MRYLAFATDYDGTLAREGRVSEVALSALARVRSSGRRTILVTGRTLSGLESVWDRLDLFDCIVGENGGTSFWPTRRETVRLAPAPPADFVERLRALRVEPLEVGDVIVATFHRNASAIAEAIHALGLELQLIWNGDALMVLPPNVNKGTGLRAALRGLGLSPHEVVGVGNAANDHSFLDVCECGVAVGDAHPALRARAAFVTRGPNDHGVVELIDELVATDLAGRRPVGLGGDVVLGVRDDGSNVECAAYGHDIFVVGPSASGKSTFASGLIERLIERSYQICVIDPEGDYGTLDDIVTLGSRRRAPEVDEIVRMLADPLANVVVNLLGIPLDDRPAYFAQLIPHLQALRARTGRPHWIVLDEAHHLMPAGWAATERALPRSLGETISITMRASEVRAEWVRRADIVVAVGPSPEAGLADFARVIGVEPPVVPAGGGSLGEVVAWLRRASATPVRMKVLRARSERLRHLRKYAEGNLGPNSFVFRGPAGMLRLRAPNLTVFCELADGVDDETWTFHLREGHYSEWMRRAIKDDALAAEVGELESAALSPAESRSRIVDAIERRYVGSV
jgi:hydroxymethylpyrimidine pyrophosphatase-like HAD family hydrolase